MTEKSRRRILVYISWFVSAVGLLVMYGWFIGSDLITHINSDLTSMKFITAFLFFLCGLQLYFLVKIFIDHRDSYFPFLITLSTISICIIILSFAILINPGIGNIIDIFPQEIKYDAWSRVPYMPSIATLIIFFITASTRLLLFFLHELTVKVMHFVAGLVIFLSILALVGNIFDVPLLFFATKHSGGMSIHTAFLFLLIGIYHFLLTPILNSRMTHSRKY